MPAKRGSLELRRVVPDAGTSVQMIEPTHGHLARGSEEHARALVAAYANRLGQERAKAQTGE